MTPVECVYLALAMIVIVAFIICGVLFPDYEIGTGKKKWPPIDDDEFVRRCPPGTRRDVALRVRRIVAEQLGVDYDRVYPEQNFVKDLGCD